MRTEMVDIYTFDELDEKAKDTAREWFRTDYPDYNWWEPIYYDFIVKVEKYGIELEENDIRFSGFYSQGDGASFVCDDVDLDKFLSYTGIKIKHGLKKIFIDNTQLFIGRTSSHYCHENTVQVNVCYQDIGDYRIDKYLNDIAENICGKLEELKNNLCNDLYKDLESCYYDLLSDDSIDDNIICNEYEFYKDGTKY